MKKQLPILLIAAILVMNVCVFSSAFSTAAAQELLSEPARYSADFVQGGSMIEKRTRSVTYSTVDVDVYENPYETAAFRASLSNACVVEAGGNVIAFYDRIYDELIEGYQHKYIWGKFTYGSQNDAVTNMFATLANMMGLTEQGTTIDGFKTGMTQYVQSRGRNINLPQATGSYLNTNIDYLKEQLSQGKMAVMFFSGFSITSFGEYAVGNGQSNMTYALYDGHHAVVLYGYRDIFYYNENRRLIERDTFFYASTGYNTVERALMSISNFCNVDDVYIVDIY